MIAPIPLGLALAGALASSSCRAMGSVMGNEYAEPQSRVQWVTLPELDPPTVANPTVWLRYKDASGSGLDLLQEVRQAVTAQGYEIVPVATDADYQLVATLQHFDKAGRFDGGESAMRKVAELAPLAGAVAGGYAGAEATGSGTGVVVGGIVGGVGGAMASSAYDNFTKVAEWDLILDLQVYEKVEGGFTETVAGTSTAEASATGGVRGGSRQMGGGNTSSVEREAAIERERSHFRNTGRLVAVAYQMTMSREEALAELMPRLPGAVASAMP